MAKAPRENRIPIMMSHEELTAIDDWRFAHRVATRSDAVRRLCQIALAVQPLIMGDAMDQVETLSDEIRSARRNFYDLREDVRAGKYAHTATPENIIDEALAELSELSDHVYWLQLQLLEANNLMVDIGASTPAAAKVKTRKTRESIEADRAALLREREEGFRNMLLIAIQKALPYEAKRDLQEMDDDAADAIYAAKIAAVEARLRDELGLGSATKLYDEARGEYRYHWEQFLRIVEEEANK